jgi:hypothetical protein
MMGAETMPRKKDDNPDLGISDSVTDRGRYCPSCASKVPDSVTFCTDCKVDTVPITS